MLVADIIREWTDGTLAVSDFVSFPGSWVDSTTRLLLALQPTKVQLITPC